MLQFFSILVATLDSTEWMLEVVSFSGLLVFLELLSVNVLQEPLQDQRSSPQFSRSCHSRHLSLHCLHLVSRSTHHCQARPRLQNLRGSHKQLCINSIRWDFETTLIWIQMDGTTRGNQMIISHQRRNVTWSDAWRKLTSFPSIDPGTRSFMNELTI